MAVIINKMSFAMKEQSLIMGVALFNGIFIYPYIKRAYRNYYSIRATPTHFAFMDIEIDGKDAGRINFELFGKDAPKTVNNFLAFCSGEYSPYTKYRDSYLHKVVHGKFIKGGDFINGDGTGAATVYDSSTIPAEKNALKFKEPYLLAASANSEGRIGSQFFITLDSLPDLNDSDHTIFGRLVSGRETINQIEGMDSFKRAKIEAQ
jgi:cyclophilin family peptidyl-prolyl cis-trans isomerase